MQRHVIGRYLQKIRIITILIVLMLLAYFFYQNLVFINNALHQLGHWAPFCFIILYILMSICFFPSFLLVLAGGALYGPVWGFVLNFIGSLAGATSCFCLGRYLFADLRFFRENHHCQKAMQLVDRFNWQAVAIMRLSPTPFNIVSYSFGITPIKFWTYILASAVFIIPNKLIVTYFGYAGMHFVR